MIKIRFFPSTPVPTLRKVSIPPCPCVLQVYNRSSSHPLDPVPSIPQISLGRRWKACPCPDCAACHQSNADICTKGFCPDYPRAMGGGVGSASGSERTEKQEVFKYAERCREYRALRKFENEAKALEFPGGDALVVYRVVGGIHLCKEYWSEVQVIRAYEAHFS